MPDLDTFSRIAFVIVCSIAVLSFVSFTKREMRWYAENVQPEPPPPLARAALRRVAVKIRRWWRGVVRAIGFGRVELTNVH